VKKDITGQETVLTNEGASLSDITELGKDEKAASAGRAISKQQFRQAIQAKAQEQAGQLKP